MAAWRFAALGAAAVAAAALTLRLAPAGQDPSYHLFADRRAFLGVANFGDVVSNAAFVLAGVLGLVALFGPATPRFEKGRERWPYGFIFGGTTLVGLGSAYYHLAPDDITLFWDRLPMTVVFMALFSTVVMERLKRDIGLAALPLLLALGVGSAVTWHLTGDLRPYIMVQFLPLALLPALLVLFPSRYTRGADLWLVLGLYVAAKVAEVLDGFIFHLSGVLSGHSIKHLLAAAAIVSVARMITKRTSLNGLAPNPS